MDAKFSVFETYQLTNDILTIRGSEGWKTLAALVDSSSTVPATISGSNINTIGGKTPTSIPVSAGKGFQFSLGNDDIDSIIITAPAGCVIYIMVARTRIENLMPMLLSFVGAASGGGSITGSVNILDQLANPINPSNPFPVEMIGTTNVSPIGGAMAVWSNVYNDFTVTTNVGTKTITLSTFPETLNAKHISNALILRKTLSGSIYIVSIVDVSQFELSSNTITLTTELTNFTSADSFDIYLNGYIKSYNRTFDFVKTGITPYLNMVPPPRGKIIGNYKTTGYTFINGSRIITIYGYSWNLNLATIFSIYNQTGTNNSNVGYIIGSPTMWNNFVSLGYNKPISTLTVGTATSGGSVTAGTHSYVVTFVYTNGDESIASVISSQISITAGNQTIPLTNIPIGAVGVTQRNIYRTIAGDTGTYKLLTSILDNATTIFSDTIADGSLGVDVPTVSNVYDITFANLPTLNTSDILMIDTDIPDETKDYTLNVQKIVNESPEWSHYTDQIEIIDSTNIAAGTYRNVIDTSGYKDYFLAIIATAGTNNTITVTLQIPLKSTCVNTDDVSWKDVTLELTGVSSILCSSIAPISLYWIFNILPIERLMIKTVITNSGTASNTLSVSIKMC
jgi:hypothetical protein